MEATQARYDKYRLYRVHLETEEHVNILKELEDISDSYTFYGHARHTDQNLTLMVAADKISAFTDLLARFKITGKILNDDVQGNIDAEKLRTSPPTATPDQLNWDNYFHLSTINAWLDKLVETYDYITPIDIGKSYEGRSTRGVKLSKKPGNTGIIVEGGIHAREWISPAVATFILNQLLTSNDDEVKSLAENFDWYFLPVVNPDGFVYSMERDRLWRKTRQPYGIVYGCDLNRNFDSHWNGPGSSSKPGAYDFAGGSVNSEPEAANLSKFVQEKIENDNVRTYLSLHSFSQLLMFAFGHTADKVSNYDELKSIGEKAVEAIGRRYGTKFQTGSIHEIIYPSSGGSMDWVKEKFDIPIAYTIELRGPPDSTDMFILPADEISPCGWETLDAFVTILKEGRTLGYFD